LDNQSQEWTVPSLAPRRIFAPPNALATELASKAELGLFAISIANLDMSKLNTSALTSISEATEYPVGLVFDATFDAFAVRLTTRPNREIHFHIAEGPFAHDETVEAVATLIRRGVFLVSWVEASGATVVHVEDFAQSVLHSHATLPDGKFLRMKAPIRVVGIEAPQ
jgi:hypothetical protein